MFKKTFFNIFLLTVAIMFVINSFKWSIDAGLFKYVGLNITQQEKIWLDQTWASRNP